MLDRLQDTLFTLYKPDEMKWLFFSCFGENKILIVSQGVITTKKTLRDLSSSLYTQIVAPVISQTAYVCMDVVTDIISFSSAEDIFSLSPLEYGFVVEDLEDEYSWVILPHMSGVTDTKQVLFDLKKKYSIHGKAAISAFRTERFVVAK